MGTASFCGGVRHKRYSGQQDLASNQTNYFMKNIFKILFLSIFLISCQQKIKPEDIPKINGYWEIEKVVFDDGKDKEYALNESYDYFQMDKKNSGFRKKVMPQLDGTFIVNKTQEGVKIRFDEDKVYLDYNTSYAKWSEELLELTDDKLVCKTKENKEYHYKKATPINIVGDGEKTK
jgi:hypothetical protein